MINSLPGPFQHLPAPAGQTSQTQVPVTCKWYTALLITHHFDEEQFVEDEPTQDKGNVNVHMKANLMQCPFAESKNPELGN